MRHAIERILHKITEACDNYEKSAPAVRDYLDELYARIEREPVRVMLAEMLFVERLQCEDGWLHPNYAQNQLVHLLERLGRESTGIIDH